MGVSLSEIFGAHVGPPLVACDGVDLGGKSRKGLFDGGDLILGGVVLELEADHMAIDAWFCRGFLVMVGGRIGAHKCKREGEGEEEDFHDRTRMRWVMAIVNGSLKKRSQTAISGKGFGRPRRGPFPKVDGKRGERGGKSESVP